MESETGEVEVCENRSEGVCMDCAKEILRSYGCDEVIPMAVVMLSAILVLGVLSVGFEAQDADGTDTASCESDGLYDGKNNPFSQELYEMCGDTYYDAYIDGCMSVEGNTRDDCESATDAD